MPYPGLARVDGALYGFWGKCEAFMRPKFLGFSGAYKEGNALAGHPGQIGRKIRLF